MSSLIVQSDLTVVLEKSSPDFKESRDFLLRFAELEKCLEYLYSYRITKLSLWNSVSLGFRHEEIISGLKERSKYPVPAKVTDYITEICLLYGSIVLDRDTKNREGFVSLHFKDLHVLEWVISSQELERTLLKASEKLLLLDWSYECGDLAEGLEKYDSKSGFRIEIPDILRGDIKTTLIDAGIPVEDIAGYQDGDPLAVSLKSTVRLRPYQHDAVHAFYQNGSPYGGSGVLALPCGAGKTVVGMAVMDQIKLKTLIVTPNVTAARQWKRELLEKTNLKEADIGEYSGLKKEIRPVTICTYQILTVGKSSKAGKAPKTDHMAEISRESWGLVICDEVHLLPAPLFRLVSNIQSRRRLGLTATLVREDNKEHHVFSLIGPKKYDIPWKILEEQGWVANAKCVEVRVDGSHLSSQLAVMKKTEAFRYSCENSLKHEVVAQLLHEHGEDSILIIGMYVNQLEQIARKFDIPLLDGSTRQKTREALYSQFREGKIKRLVVSKVANNAVDLPDASVAIQVSGMFGSRQEEAQRLGRILRPKANGNAAHFYSVITGNSPEQDFAFKRQLFLVEQGYEYEIRNA